MGETIRGEALDFIDSAVGTSKHHDETERGAEETEEGIARMEHGKAAAELRASAQQPGTAADSSTHPNAASNEKPHEGQGGGGHGTGEKTQATHRDAGPGGEEAA